MLTQTKVPDLCLAPSPPDPDGARNPRRLSDILQEIADASATPEERISLGHLIEGFGNRAYGALLFIFAVPVALPIAIPGISAVLGAPLLFLSWQLMRGRKQPWLPQVMRGRSFRRADFARMLQRVLPSIRRVERLVGPRLIRLTNRRGEQVRVLRQLREEGLVTFQKGRVAFDDFGRLRELASFDTAYLDQDGPLLR